MGSMIGIHQQAGVLSAYTATPAQDMVCRGAVIVLHDIWGLSDHIKSVAERFAAAGYYAIAPDLLFVAAEKRKTAEEFRKNLNAPPTSKEYADALRKFRALLASTQTPQFTSLALSRLEACVDYVYNQPIARQRIAVVGFGFGGTYAYSLAMRDSRLRAAVPFYGHAEFYRLELRHIACPILAFYGALDSVTHELAGLEPNMARAGVRFTPVVYPNAGSSFFNETNPATYDQTSAEDAWRRTISFLRISLA